MPTQSASLLLALEENRPDLTRFLRRRLGCEDTAEDVLQSLSERLLGDGAAEKVDNQRAYLFRAAANAAHSHARREKRRTDYETAAAAHRDQADSLDPERMLIGHQMLKALQEALSELPLLTQRMFIAFKIHGESQKSIARRFGVSLSTVEKRLAKAVIHCQRRIEACGFTDDALGKRPKCRSKEQEASSP